MYVASTIADCARGRINQHYCTLLHSSLVSYIHCSPLSSRADTRYRSCAALSCSSCCSSCCSIAPAAAPPRAASPPGRFRISSSSSSAVFSRRCFSWRSSMPAAASASQRGRGRQPRQPRASVVSSPGVSRVISRGISRGLPSLPGLCMCLISCLACHPECDELARSCTDWRAGGRVTARPGGVRLGAHCRFFAWRAPPAEPGASPLPCPPPPPSWPAPRQSAYVSTHFMEGRRCS